MTKKKERIEVTLPDWASNHTRDQVRRFLWVLANPEKTRKYTADEFAEMIESKYRLGIFVFPARLKAHTTVFEVYTMQGIGYDKLLFSLEIPNGVFKEHIDDPGGFIC